MSTSMLALVIFARITFSLKWFTDPTRMPAVWAMPSITRGIGSTSMRPESFMAFMWVF